MTTDKDQKDMSEQKIKFNYTKLRVFKYHGAPYLIVSQAAKAIGCVTQTLRKHLNESEIVRITEGSQQFVCSPVSSIIEAAPKTKKRKAQEFANFLRAEFPHYTKIVKQVPIDAYDAAENAKSYDGVQTFDFHGDPIRVVTKDGQPWFLLTDLARVMEIQNVVQLRNRLDEDGVSSAYATDSLGRSQAVSIVNKANMYRVIMRSDKPEAVKFQNWVTDVVLVAIDEHGGYLTPEKTEEALLNPDTIIQLAQNLKDEQEKRKQLEHQKEVDAPKVRLADAVEASEEYITLTRMSQILNGLGVGMNRMEFCQFLRDEGFLYKQAGKTENLPIRQYEAEGLFKVKYMYITHAERVTATTYVTGKGQRFFINYFLEEVAA